MLVLDTRRLVSKSFNGDDLFLLRQEFGAHGTVGDEEPEAYANDQGEQASGDHVNSPRMDDLGVDVVDAERDDTVEDLGSTVHQEPLEMVSGFQKQKEATTRRYSHNRHGE